MLLDFTPLRRHRDFRLLYFSQLISFLGTMFTYVAIPYQVYKLTGSNFLVGAIGIAQLIPLLLTGVIGGAFADAVDRRKLLIGSELGLALCALVLTLNSLLPSPQVWLIFVVAAVASGLTGFHRPAMESMTPRLVRREEMPAVAALSSLRGNIGMIGGPALGGICIAKLGLPATYAFDVLTFVFSLISISAMRAMPAAQDAESPSLKTIREGLAYARSRQELIGTYVVDIVAMVFGMPMALFPAIAETMGGPSVLGWLYAAPSVGALIVTLTSGWTSRVTRHGAAIIWAAGVWGVAIIVFGFMSRIEWALVFLAVAGGADMVSAIFRSTIWNQTIPDRLRGRLAGVEMISYMSGPQIGNAEAGLAAALGGLRFSIVSGGVLCVAGVAACVFFLPKFWSYDSRKYAEENGLTQPAVTAETV